jgi:hypothetical protein
MYVCIYNMYVYTYPLAERNMNTCTRAYTQTHTQHMHAYLACDGHPYTNKQTTNTRMHTHLACDGRLGHQRHVRPPRAANLVAEPPPVSKVAQRTLAITRFGIQPCIRVAVALEGPRARLLPAARSPVAADVGRYQGVGARRAVALDLGLQDEGVALVKHEGRFLREKRDAPVQHRVVALPEHKGFGVR